MPTHSRGHKTDASPLIKVVHLTFGFYRQTSSPCCFLLRRLAWNCAHIHMLRSHFRQGLPHPPKYNHRGDTRTLAENNTNIAVRYKSTGRPATPSKPTNQLTNIPTNQVTNRPTDQILNRPSNHPNDQATSETTDEPTKRPPENESTIQLNDQLTTNQPNKRLTDKQLTGRSIVQPVDQRNNQQVNQQPINPTNTRAHKPTNRPTILSQNQHTGGLRGSPYFFKLTAGGRVDKRRRVTVSPAFPAVIASHFTRSK